ncbi:uncharacterized protein LOC106647058 isoform X2 [Copidosoma floridanum]|uniref:uncharacterized protein LOC106647058 isoform X2 n=1 Tax=Copidosoma floridanum TaxID=29053 RepID=UPI0006C94F4F|nr:uncharacterized protein LOC106647058 isoform X2 [Copidosoma floridanum]
MDTQVTPLDGSKYYLMNSTLDCTYVQEYNKRCYKVLRELKKILQEDVLVKSKLKHMLKNYPFSTHTTDILLNLNYESSFFPESKLNNHNYSYLEPNNTKLKKKRVSAECYRNSYEKNVQHFFSSNDDLKKSCKESPPYPKNTPVFSNNVTDQTNTGSNTPPTSFPVLKDKKFKLDKQDLNDALMDSSGNKSFFNITPNASSKNADRTKKFLVSSNILSSLNQPVSKSWACSTTESTISFKTILPHKCSSFTNLTVNKEVCITMKNEKVNPENGQLLMESLYASNTQIISVTPSQGIEQCTDNNHKKLLCNCNIRSRSISSSKASRSLSRSPLRNLMDVQNRSWSKSSTYLSSPTHSHDNFSSSSRSASTTSQSTSRLISTDSGRSRSPSIPRRYGSPSFLDRRRITSARKRPVPYNRPTPSPTSSSSKSSSESDGSHRSCKSSLSYSDY